MSTGNNLYSGGNPGFAWLDTFMEQANASEILVAVTLTILILALLAHVVMGLISHRVTHNRGRRGGFWWGFCLGVLGIIVAAVRPKE